MPDMKRIYAIVFLSIATVLSASAQIKIGAGAGYSLDNQYLYLKGSSFSSGSGYAHGFYAGADVKFPIGSNFSLVAGLKFQKLGSDFNADGVKVVTGINESSRSIAHLYDSKHLADNGYSDADISAIQKDGYMEFKYGDESKVDVNNLQPWMLYPILKNGTLKGNLSLWNLSLPISACYSFGPLTILAGIDVGVNVYMDMECKVSAALSSLSLNVFDISNEATKHQLYTADYHINYKDGDKFDEKGKMEISEFLRKDVLNTVTFGAHAGAEVCFINHIGLRVIYYHDILSNVQSRWNNTLTGASSALQIGLMYYF